MTVSSTSGFSIQNVFDNITSNISTYSSNLETALSKVDGKTLTQEDYLSLQFQVNMYNMLLETISTISKSLTDEAKQIAQRSN